MPGMRIVLGLVVLVAAVVAAQGSAAPAAAATNKGWIGGANGNFFIASNWLPAGVPKDGDVLIFHRASNGLADTITVLGNYQQLPKIASITSDIYNLKITGVMTITKSIFAETNKTTIAFDSLTLDTDAAQFVMQQSSLVPELMSYVRVDRQLTMHGTLDVNKGRFSVYELIGTGAIAGTDATMSFSEADEFSGTISGNGNSELTFTTPPSGTCDQSGTRLIADATARISLDATCAQSFASIEGSGTIRRFPTTQGIIQLAITDATGIFNGSVAPDALVALTCCGTGTQRLGGDLSRITQIDVTGGSLVAENLTLDTTAITNIGHGAVFGGYGRLGSVSVNDGTLLMGSRIGHFENVYFTSSGRAAFQLTGLAPASTGPVDTRRTLDLGSASVNGTADSLTVEFKNGFVPPVGQQLLLITGASDVQGTFKGLPEGAIANFGGYSFAITYEGGASGHDVVITRQAAQSTPTPTPSGPLKYRRFIPVVGKDG